LSQNIFTTGISRPQAFRELSESILLFVCPIERKNTPVVTAKTTAQTKRTSVKTRNPPLCCGFAGQALFLSFEKKFKIIAGKYH